MKFPSTQEAMIAAGYSRRCFTECRGCKAPIEFWNTPAKQTYPDGPDAAGR